MQVWDQVKVIKAGDTYENQAGVVQAQKGTKITVKMDSDDSEQVYVEKDLQLLGR